MTIGSNVKAVLAATFVVATTACGHAATTATTTSSGGGDGGGGGDRAALVAKAKEQLGELAKRVGEYELKNGHCPGGMNDVAGATAPKDPWGNDVAYMPASPENPSNAFVSSGPDGQLLTSDDITVRAECSQ